MTIPDSTHGPDTLPNLRGDQRSVGPFSDVFGLTHRGHVRDHNEDHFLLLDVERCVVVRQASLAAPHTVPGTIASLMVVADGMGGHSNGELASAVTLDTIAAYAAHSMPVSPDYASGVSALRAGFQAAALECQRRLRAAAARRQQPSDLGTTLTAVYAAGQWAEIAHVGDSRAYLLRQGRDLYQLTRDHTLAQQLAERGHPVSGRLADMLTNSIGGSDADPKVDGDTLGLEPNDRLLLCTDGLTKHLDDDAIEAVLAGGGSARESVEQLVAQVLETDATDNVTVIVADV